MDTSNPETTSKDGGPTKSPFDDLSKDELINKCKGLLAIAQKAKQAKTELQNEVSNFKLQLEKSETEKKNVQQNVQTLQELVDSLTAQKLTMITDLDKDKNVIKTLSIECKDYQDKVLRFKEDLTVKEQNITELTQKLSDIDCEVISLKRQNNRLSEENEQLINQLTEIEARTAEFNNIGLQQREQLKMLEQHVLKEEKHGADLELLNKKISELENQLKIAEEKVQLTEDNEIKMKDLKKLYENEIIKNDKANVKLRSYKDKILRCASCITQLKNSRYILNKTVKEYSENIPKWQNDILKASQILDCKISDLNKENLELKQKISLLEQQLEVTKTAPQNNVEIEEIKREKILLETQVEQLQKISDESKHKNLEIQQEFNELKLKYGDVIDKELPSYIEENKLLQDKVNENIDNIYALNNKNKEITEIIEELKKENETLNHSLQNQNPDIIESLTLQIKALESEKDILVKEKLNAKDSNIDLENNNKLLTEQLHKLKLDLQTLKAQLDEKIQENIVLVNNHKTQREEEVNVLKCKLKTQEEQFNLIKKEYDDMQDLNNLLKEKVETLKNSLEQPKDDTANLSDINISLQADLVKLETKLASYKQENETLLNEIKESRNKVKECDAILSEYHEAKSKLVSYKTENAELLNEMKEINQVLKERGESISKQQKAIVEMERLIETLEKDRDSTNEEKKELVQKIDTLESQIKDAENKTSENNEYVEQLLVERDDAKKELEDNNQAMAALKEEIEKLKSAAPVAADLPNEDMSTSTISRAEDYSRMKDLDETFEDKYSKLRIFALKLKKKLNETSTLLQNAQQDKAKLEKMLSENVPVETKVVHSTQTSSSEPDNKTNSQQEINELQEKITSLTAIAEEYENVKAELDKVKAQLSLKTQELATEIEAHKVTKDNLEKARRDVKKKNVLSLEMEDYERSMKELTAKMEEKKKKMVQMESTIDTQEGIITTMKTQIKLLEEQIKTEETQTRLTKEELHHALEESKNKDNIILAKNSIMSKLEQELEDEKRKNEETDLEMTSLISEKEKIIMSLGEDKAELNNKVKRLEFKCSELNEKLKITNMELADLKSEYTSYKVRAQAVLRQNQTVDHSQEEQLKEEAAALRAQIETFTSKLNLAQEQCAEQTVEAENARRRASEASNEATRAQQRTARLHSDLTRLAQQFETERTQHKLQISTLTQCYKSQISELEIKLQKETELLKKQLALAQDNAIASNQQFIDDSNQNQYMLPVIPKDDSDGEMDINVSMIPREEGEGSESAPSPPLSKSYMSGGGGGRSPVPLERLLEEGVPDDEALDTSSLGLTPDQEIADLKRRLTAQQQRVKHVTVLLSESERECARMAQLSELLKAELRRVRGTSQNTHNTEYMKNVTLKFLTLPPGDERSRLVPVLQKILTLTPDETQKIHAVAKGLDPNPSKGWGSYLPWPGGSK